MASGRTSRNSNGGRDTNNLQRNNSAGSSSSTSTSSSTIGEDREAANRPDNSMDELLGLVRGFGARLERLERQQENITGLQATEGGPGSGPVQESDGENPDDQEESGDNEINQAQRQGAEQLGTAEALDGGGANQGANGEGPSGMTLSLPAAMVAAAAASGVVGASENPAPAMVVPQAASSSSAAVTETAVGMALTNTAVNRLCDLLEKKPGAKGGGAAKTAEPLEQLRRHWEKVKKLSDARNMEELPLLWKDPSMFAYKLNEWRGPTGDSKIWMRNMHNFIESMVLFLTGAGRNITVEDCAGWLRVTRPWMVALLDSHAWYKTSTGTARPQKEEKPQVERSATFKQITVKQSQAQRTHWNLMKARVQKEALLVAESVLLIPLTWIAGSDDVSPGAVAQMQMRIATVVDSTLKGSAADYRSWLHPS